MTRSKPHQSRRSATGKHGRRHRPRWRILAAYGPDGPPGDDIVSATPEELLEAMSRQPADLPWPVMSANVLPLIARIRPYPFGMDDGIRAMASPGITVGFGVDFGPGFITVTPSLLEQWSKSVADVMACALANVHTRAAMVDPSSILVGGPEGARTEWLQTGRSIGSVLVLAPTELQRLFGSEPRRFITPMRDLIIGFPLDANPELVGWYWAEIASQDPNCLGPMSYVFQDGRVTPMPLDAAMFGQGALLA